MSQWKPYTLPMIPGVPHAMEAASTAAGTLGTLLDTLSGLLDALATLADLMLDPMGEAISSLLAVIEGLANQLTALLQSGVYLYVDQGPFFTGSRPDGLTGVLRRLEASFEDPGDRHRPQFGEGSSVSALLFCVGGDDPSLVLGPLRTLGSLFGIPALHLDDPGHLANYPAALEATLSVPPDWQSVSMRQAVPPFDALAATLHQAAGLLSTGDSYGKLLQGLAQLIAKKAETLESLSDEIDTVVTKLLALVEAQGLYVLALEAEGTHALVQAAWSAGSVPPWGNEAHVAGVCLLGGTASFAPVRELLGG